MTNAVEPTGLLVSISLMPSSSSSTCGASVVNTPGNRATPSGTCSPPTPSLRTDGDCAGYWATRSVCSNVGYDVETLMLAARICRSPICGPSVKALAEVHGGSSVPAVMLSPKATNFVALIFGGLATVTPKLHDAVCCFASRAVQMTVADPTLN